MGGSIIIFGADMSLSVHVHNKNKDILISGEGPAQALDDTTFATKVIYPINFTQPNKRFVYTILEATVSYLLMLDKYMNSKQKPLKQKIINCV